MQGVADATNLAKLSDSYQTKISITCKAQKLVQSGEWEERTGLV